MRLGVNMASSLKLNEVFYSIQGEGIYQGEPTVFIRLQGCNLKCTFCDTKYATGEKAKRSVEPAHLARELQRDFGLYNKHICITGGEPLLQDSKVYSLLTFLNLFNCRISIETNGSLIPPTQLSSLVTSWVVDYKLPSSGSFKSFNKEWYRYLQNFDQLKFVASNPEDLKVALQAIRTLRKTNIHKPTILISPVFNGEDLDKEFCNICIEFCKTNNCRFSLQIHKIIWGVKKGV